MPDVQYPDDTPRPRRTNEREDPPTPAMVINEIGPMLFTASLEASPNQSVDVAEVPFEERSLEQVCTFLIYRYSRDFIRKNLVRK